METSTAIPDVTPGIAVSNATMLCLKSPSAHIRTGSHQVSQTCATAYHNCSINITIDCTCDPRTKTCCPSFYTCSHMKGHTSAHTHLYTKCSTCATMTIRQCLHSTKMPDHRDVTQDMTGPGSTNDVPDPKYPWITLAICALRYWALSRIPEFKLK